MSDLRPDARALVEAGRDSLRPTAADRARNFAALQARLDLGTPGHQGPGPSGASSGGLGWPALSAIGVGVAVSGLLAFFALRSPTQRPPAAPVATAAEPALPAAPVAAPAAPAAAAPSVEPTESPAPETTAASPDARNSVASHARSSDRLAEEVAILSRAETDLHGGRYAAALSELDEHARKFPHGMLTQERIAARAQALCGLGRNAEAEASLRRLGPGSLQGARAREACAAKQ